MNIGTGFVLQDESLSIVRSPGLNPGASVRDAQSRTPLKERTATRAVPTGTKKKERKL
ncbi:MAG: hypothetical protein KAX39_06575 [candidate division Zixibacteria bacterium]|nr:hypothetical protein [candidate division Zixibacteria bacterium]